MNICPYCGKKFEINPFGSGGKNRIYCYSCLPEGLPREVRNKIRDYLNIAIIVRDKIKRGCDNCGYNKNATALEWHHPNDDKIYNPSTLLKEGKFREYQKEIRKCILLCANCHREIHHPNFEEQLLLENTNNLITELHKKYPNSVNDNNFYIKLIQDIINFYEKVKSIKQTAQYFNCEESTISNILKKNKCLMFNRYQGIPVAMLDEKGEVIKIFNCMADAYRYLGCSQSNHITDVCKGKRKTAYGYKWKYL